MINDYKTQITLNKLNDIEQCLGEMKVTQLCSVKNIKFNGFFF